ncbi:MAG TPA: ATPase domain-containing protein [Aggregatilineales bacterium]|nr:ATPase domain-containing protein [Aggregatilineales bacterium]
MSANENKRLMTGISGLDSMLNGGFIPESMILLRGAPGTGKTTLAFQFLLEGAQQGEPGLFISFEEFPKSLYNDAASLGWDLTRYEADGSLRMVFTSAEVLSASLATPDSPILRVIEEHNIRRVVVDSLTHFTRLSSDTHELRAIYASVVNAFRREGVTALFLAEETRSDFSSEEKGRLSFIVDCIVMLRYLEIDSAIQRAILVLKMRSSDHDKTIHGYTIGAGGISIGTTLDGHLGLLSGISRQTMISSVQSPGNAKSR